MTIRLLDRFEMRRVAKAAMWRPFAADGQYFLHDVRTVRRLAAACGARREDHVLEVGAGMGSLTLALLGTGARVSAVEADPVLARLLPAVIAEHSHREVQRLSVLHRDGLTVGRRDFPDPPTIVVAHLPAPIAEATVLHLLTEFPSLRAVLLITDATVTERLAAGPGDPRYQPGGVKLRWFGTVTRAGTVPRAAWWPHPRFHHGVLRLACDQRPAQQCDAASRTAVFDLIDLAFAHPRTTARHAFTGWAGSGRASAAHLLTASIDPARRAISLTIEDFVRLHDRSPLTT